VPPGPPVGAGNEGVSSSNLGPSGNVVASGNVVPDGGASGDSTSQHSPLLEALADGSVFEDLPSALKRQIQGSGDQGSGDTVSGASTTQSPAGGGALVAATPSGPGGEPSPFGKVSAGVRTESPESSTGSVSPTGFMGFAGGPPRGPGGAGMPPLVVNAGPLGTPPGGAVSQGDAGTPQREDVSSPAVVAGGTGWSGGIVLQSTEAGYKAEDGVVVFTLSTGSGGIHAQVSSKDGRLLSERPILNVDSLRSLSQRAKQELTVRPSVKGE